MPRDLFEEAGINNYQPRDLFLERGIDIAPQNKEKISRGEAAFTTLTNVPFAPRIKAGVAAGVAKAFGGEVTKNDSFSDLYNEALKDERSKLTQAREQYPIQSFLTQLPADIALGPKGGQSVASVIGKAATLSGLQAAGETKDLTDIGQTAADVGSAVAVSALTSGLISGVGKGYQKLFNTNPTAAVSKMNADDVKSLATDAYKVAAEKGGVLKSQFIDNLIGKASEFDKQTKIGKALTGSSPISQIKEALAPFKGKKLDLASLQEVDEVLGDKIDDYVENGVIKKAGLPLLKLQSSLREMIDSASPEIIEGGKQGFESLREARALWSKAAKLRDIEKIITRAEMTDNPATAIKTGFRTLFSNSNRFKYFNQEEKKLIKEAAKSGIVTDTLRTFGSRLIPIGEIVGGGGISSAVVGQATSMASRNLATRSQIAKANKVSQQILGNLSPKANSVINPLNPIIAARLASQNLYKPEEQ